MQQQHQHQHGNHVTAVIAITEDDCSISVMDAGGVDGCGEIGAPIEDNATLIPGRSSLSSSRVHVVGRAMFVNDSFAEDRPVIKRDESEIELHVIHTNVLSNNNIP
eukprot:c15430_g1_i1.p1 GENE.c15430_g1_i1~~c15430_g1_i1.p1  ORF type:complete len:114 (+),score=45.77 c15430_g1_i1:27-344(+)